MSAPTDASAAMTTRCPSCGQPMAVHRLDRKPHGSASIDLCAPCRALWFDGYESVQLSPGATLALLKAIHEAERTSPLPLASQLACPRCTSALALTRDLQRSTRFTYYRCGRGHGRYTPFLQFLLEKSFVRPLPPPELERLKRAVGTIRCSGCGAGIDLARDAACPYCRAPITVLDPGTLARTVESLSAAEARRHQVDPIALADALAQAERMDRALATPDSPAARADAILSAVELGATALDVLFGALRRT